MWQPDPCRAWQVESSLPLAAGVQNLLPPQLQQPHPLNVAVQQEPQLPAVHGGGHAELQKTTVAAWAGSGATTDTMSGTDAAAAPTFAARNASSRRVEPPTDSCTAASSNSQLFSSSSARSTASASSCRSAESASTDV